MCYYDSSACGTQDEYTLTEGESVTINISGLARGRSCFYRVSSECAAPAFSVGTAETATNGDYEVEYIEFDGSAMSTNDTVWFASDTGTSISDTARNSAPESDMPIRSTEFGSGSGAA